MGVDQASRAERDMVALVSDGWRRVPFPPAFVCLASDKGYADPRDTSPDFSEISFPSLQNGHQESASLTER